MITSCSCSNLQETQKVKRSDKIEDYKIVKFLGKGAYSDVYLGQNVQNNKFSAIKVIDKTFLERQNKQHHVFIERDVLQQLHHPGVIQLTSTFQTKLKLYFCLEYASKGDLASFIKNNEPLSFEQIQFCTAQILLSLEYIHKNGIVHRDLKPENLLLTQDYHIKLTDFATAMVFDENKMGADRASRIKQFREKYSKSFRSTDKDTQDTEDQDVDVPPLCRSSSFVGTSEYLSPELIDNNVSGPASDLWALGCILYKMLSGNTPFQDELEYNMFQRITQEEFQTLPEAPQQAKDLLNILLSKTHSVRFGANFNIQKMISIMMVLKIIHFLMVQTLQICGYSNQHWIQNQVLYLNDNDKSSINFNPLLMKHQGMLGSQNDVKSNYYFSLVGQLDKESGFLMFTHYSLRIMTLSIYKNTPLLSYMNPQKDNKKIIIPLDSLSKCRLLDNQGKFIVEDKNHKKYIFKEKEQPAILWVQEINRVINNL